MRAATNDASAGANCTQRADGQVMFSLGSSAAGPVVSARGQFQTIVGRPQLEHCFDEFAYQFVHR